jgi:hypothetical protein
MIAAECLYIWCMMFVKLSLGLFFLRIVVETWQRKVVYIMVASSWVVGIAYFWYAIFQCGIPNGNGIAEWETRLNDQCGSPTSVVLGVSYAHAIVNMLTDISLVLIPIPTLRTTRISYKEKLVVMGIFAVAVWYVVSHLVSRFNIDYASGCAGSVVRFAFIPSLANTTESFFGKYPFH